MSMLDASSGTVLRTISPSAPSVRMYPIGVAVDVQGNRTLVTSNGDLHNQTGSVAGLDTWSGRILWTVPVAGELNPAAVDTPDGRVFVSSDTGDVTVLDAQSGRLLSTIAVGSEPDAPLVDERSGRVFVVNRGDGTVSMLDARSGRVVRTITVVENPGALDVDARAGRILVASTNVDHQGRVSVLDARNGGVLRTMLVGAQPIAVAIDHQTRRAFVVNYGGSVREPAGWWAPWVSRLRRWLPRLPRPVAIVRTEPASVSVIDASRV